MKKRVFMAVFFLLLASLFLWLSPVKADAEGETGFSFNINSGDVWYVELGETKALPEIITDVDLSTVRFTYSWSKTGIASVNFTDFTVSGVQDGYTVLTANMIDNASGQQLASCELPVSVVISPTRLELPVDEITVAKGATVSIPAPIREPDSISISLYIKIDYADSTIASGSTTAQWDAWESPYDFPPKFTGKSAGTTTVTVSAKRSDGTILSDTMTVHVDDTKYWVDFEGNATYFLGSSTVSARPAGVTEPVLAPFGTTIQLPDCGFVLPGHRFTGWNTAKNGSGTAYAAGADFCVNAGDETPYTTLYAQWEIEEFPIHYVLNGGEPNVGDTLPETYHVGARTSYGYLFIDDYAQLPLPYVFKNKCALKGWYFDSAFTQFAGSPGSYGSGRIALDQLGEYTLYAKWYTNQFTVHYDGNGATSGEMEDKTYTMGNYNSLSYNQFTKTGSTFNSWNTEPDGSGTRYLGGSNPNITNPDQIEGNFDFTLYAQWNTKQYTITYYNGSNPDNPNTFTYDTPDIIFLPPNDKTGYDFEGWYSDSAFTTPITGVPTHSQANVTAYAKFVPHHYTVHFDLNGGTSDPLPDVAATYGQSFAFPDYTLVDRSYSELEYYVLSGWNTEADGSGTNFAYDTQTAKNLTAEDGGEVTLYAQWQPMFYLIHYDANGGTGSMSDQASSPFGQYDTIRACQFTRTGARFAGWHTNPDGTGMHYIAGEQVRCLGAAGETVTLYAGWSFDRYNIYYYNVSDEGVDNSANPVSFTYADVENGPLTLTSPTWEGHTFAGWYTDAQLTEPADAVPQGALSTQYFYAKWELDSWKIRFNGNGSVLTPANGSMNILTCYYGEDIQLPANKFTRNGCKMTGWNTKADGSGTAYEKNALITGFTAEKDAVIDLYAQWQFYQYSIKYWRLGLSGSIGTNPKTYNVETPDIVLGPASRLGYDFLGWYYDGNYTQEVTVIPQGSTGKQILFAKWKAHRYTVNFDGNGATSGTMKPMTCKYSIDYTLRKNTFKRTGYVFTGWNTKASGKGSAYTDEQEFRNLKSAEGASVTFYAQWKPITYTVRYYGNGSDDGEMSSDVFTYGKTYKLSACGYTKTACGFLGWSTNADGTGTLYNNKASVTNLSSTQGTVIKLYARWKPKKPELVLEKKSCTENKITVSNLYGIEGYEFYRATAKNGTYKLVGTSESKNFSTEKDCVEFVDDRAVSGKTYYYKARAYFTNSKGEKVYGSYSAIISIKTALKPDFIARLDMKDNGYYDSYFGFYVINNGPLPIEFGKEYTGNSFATSFLPKLTPYTNASSTTCWYGMKSNFIVEANDSGYCTMHLEKERYINPDQAFMMVFYTYDGISYMDFFGTAGPLY